MLDLLTHYPRRYIDRTRQATIAELDVGEEGVILAEVQSCDARRLRGKRVMVTAKLVDVHPDGRAFNLCDGIVRTRYRDSFTEPKLLEANQVYRYEIDLWVTSNVFLPGHRVRLEVSSSNFPRFDRNPNSGKAFGTDTELLTAKQAIYHGGEHASSIILPVIPRP